MTELKKLCNTLFLLDDIISENAAAHNCSNRKIVMDWNYGWFAKAAFDTDGGPVVRDPQKSCRTTRTFKPSGPMDHRKFQL